MLTIAEYREDFLEFLKQDHFPKSPIGLYEPITYILNLGGKRLRPVLTLMAADAFGADYKKANYAALAVETFHNFSLMHDDIMDEAPLRRGQQTVHEKWDTNTGILSGDAMLILAYQFFEQYEGSIFKDLAKLFSKTAVEVCEGQQYDMEFELREDVSLKEYLLMIKYKTAVLVGAALKMGAIVAQAKEEEAQKIYDFGINLGLAFQIQDDFLDAFGDPLTFGKQVGGDIIENKKTFLYISAMENASKEDKMALEHLFSIQPEHHEEKVATVKELYERCGVVETCKNTIAQYTNEAFEILNTTSLSEDNKEEFIKFGKALMERTV